MAQKTTGAMKDTQRRESGKPGVTRYTDPELEEFKALIIGKMEEARADYEMLKNAISGEGTNSTDDTSPTFRLVEDLSDVFSKEEMAHLANRRHKYLEHLRNALVRIQNKTYGICRVTGELISRERLRSVPHTTLSINAKTGAAGL